MKISVKCQVCPIFFRFQSFIEQEFPNLVPLTDSASIFINIFLSILKPFPAVALFVAFFSKILMEELSLKTPHYSPNDFKRFLQSLYNRPGPVSVKKGASKTPLWLFFKNFCAESLCFSRSNTQKSDYFKKISQKQVSLKERGERSVPDDARFQIWPSLGRMKWAFGAFASLFCPGFGLTGSNIQILLVSDPFLLFCGVFPECFGLQGERPFFSLLTSGFSFSLFD